ncbi:MAG: hypothetical protein ACJAU6_004146 [Alphaproteobacteria bacterium]|jgi:hypothetical protein
MNSNINAKLYIKLRFKAQHHFQSADTCLSSQEGDKSIHIFRVEQTLTYFKDWANNETGLLL